MVHIPAYEDNAWRTKQRTYNKNNLLYYSKTEIRNGETAR